MRWQIVRLGEVSSTQAEAKALAESRSAEGTVVVAEAQTGGRGRRGRGWHSLPGGLYMTAVLRPTSSPGLIPLMAGVAVSETMRTLTGVDAKLEWPNDILVGERKIGGILSESAWSKGKLRYTLLGIGVNLNNPLPPTLPEATTLSTELGEEFDIDQFLDELLRRLDGYLGLLESNASKVLKAWRLLSSTLGSPVEIALDSGETIHGVAVDIDRDGALILKTNGRRIRVVSGSVRRRYY